MICEPDMLASSHGPNPWAEAGLRTKRISWVGFADAETEEAFQRYLAASSRVTDIFSLSLAIIILIVFTLVRLPHCLLCGFTNVKDSAMRSCNAPMAILNLFLQMSLDLNLLLET